MKHDPDFLLRYHEGQLSAEERSRAEATLGSDASLAQALAETGTIRTGLQASRSDSFRPFFSERVLRRIRPAEAPELSLYLSLRWAFVRATAVAAIAAIVLAGINAGTYGELGVTSSVIDAAFGIPDASPLDAWSYAVSSPEHP
jgi:anti-sigma factor RsiW